MRKYTVNFHTTKYKVIAGIGPMPCPAKRRVTLYSKSAQRAKAEAKHRVPDRMYNCFQTIDWE